MGAVRALLLSVCLPNRSLGRPRYLFSLWRGHARFHSTLDHVDVSNRAMMDAMDQLLRVDYEMCQTYGDPVSQTMAHMALPSSMRLTAKAAVRFAANCLRACACT